MLDRVLMQDDWRGLNEGVDDLLPTLSKFILMVEHKSSRHKVRILSFLTSYCQSIFSYTLNYYITYIISYKNLKVSPESLWQ